MLDIKHRYEELRVDSEDGFVYTRVDFSNICRLRSANITALGHTDRLYRRYPLYGRQRYEIDFKSFLQKR